MGKISLADIVKLPAFEEAGSLFHKATGMAISFEGDKSEAIFYPAREKCDFCQLIQSTEKGRERCKASDKRAAGIALKEHKALYYPCHAGLIDVVVPVVVGTHKIGCFYSGQSMLTPPTPEAFEQVRMRLADLDLAPEKLREAYKRVPVVDEEKLRLAMGLLSIICSHLVDSEMALRQERQLTMEQRKLRRAAEEKARLERDLRDMELRLLQAQLNPHFLFNALNLILGEAMTEDAPKTSCLVEELSVLLRNSLARIGKMVPLDEEIASAQAYIKMFEARFEKSVKISVNVPSDLRQMSVPALILQPLVENALVHAQPKCTDILCIHISAVRTPDAINISVSDNGPGISTDELKSIRSRIKNRDPEDKMTGMVGLNRRLKYYYKDVRDLRVSSSNGGLMVTIVLPV